LVRYQARALTNAVGPRPSPLEASFWHVKQVDPAWDDLGSRARVGILPSSSSCAIGVASDSGGCTDRHLNSQGLRIELPALQPDSSFRAECPSEGEVCKHMLMQTLARPPYSFVHTSETLGYFGALRTTLRAPKICARNFTCASPNYNTPTIFNSITVVYPSHGRCSPKVHEKWNHGAL
jgi:hypothetical protein